MVGAIFKHLVLHSRTRSALRCGAYSVPAIGWLDSVLTYDGLPSYTVSIMEFRDGKVAREAQYFGDPFEPGASRAQWVERTR